MKKRKAFKLHLALLFVSSAILFAPRAAMACTCSELFTPPCVAFQRADLVFTGTLTEVVRPAEDNNIRIAAASFIIESVFKGESRKEITLNFIVSSCEFNLEPNNRYFVYAHKDPTGKMMLQPCDRTRLLAAAGDDLEYVNKLSASGPRQSIMGVIMTLKEDDLKNIRITVIGEQGSIEAPVDNDGFFNGDVKAPGTYKVRMNLPFEARPVARTEMRENGNSASVVEYTVNLQKGQCDYRELYIGKKGSVGTISGIVVDKNGSPIQGLILSIYPYSQNQDFSSAKGRSVRTNKSGRYIFNEVNEGQYTIGVNLGETPELDTPYPKTFFPGVLNFESAYIISVAKDQRLNLDRLIIPTKLVKRKITGKLVWPDGTPVTKLRLDSPSYVKPVLYLLSPDGLKNIVPFDSEGNKLEIDEFGNFSFVGYEGYSYVIHAHAFDKDNKLFHSRHIKLTISEASKPLELILSEPGAGESDNEIRKELVQAPSKN